MGLEKEAQSVFSNVLNTFEKLQETLQYLKSNNDFNSTKIDFKKKFIEEHINSTNIRIDTLNTVLRKKNFSMHTINGISQMIRGFVRHFGDSMFETDKSEFIKSLISDLMYTGKSLDRLHQKYKNQSKSFKNYNNRYRNND